MERALFDAVQQKLTEQWTTRSTTRNAGVHLLTGLLFDDAGHRMVATHATKAGIRYRYYVSLPHLHRESKTASVGSVSRIPATEIEDVVVKSINEHLIARRERPASGAAKKVVCRVASGSNDCAMLPRNGAGSSKPSDLIRNYTDRVETALLTPKDSQ
jgi:hypothetical protein